MKDYSNYSYQELYGMVNHMYQFEYPDRIKEIETEIEHRKLQNEIPTDIIPRIDWSPFKFWKKE